MVSRNYDIPVFADTLSRQLKLLITKSLLPGCLFFSSTSFAKKTVPCEPISNPGTCGVLVVPTDPDSIVYDFSKCQNESGLVIRLDGNKVRCRQVIKNFPFEAGFYKVRTEIEYSADQNSEHYYLQVIGVDTTGPCDATNFDRYLVIRDSTGVDGRVFRNDGVFYFNGGEDLFFKHGNTLSGTGEYGMIESLHLFELVLERIEKDTVLKLIQFADRDSVAKGDTVRYTLTLNNISSADTARTIRLWDILPDSVTYVEGTDSLQAPLVEGNTLTWRFDSLLPDSLIEIQYTVIVDSSFLKIKLPRTLVNRSEVRSSCGKDTATVFVVVTSPLDPPDLLLTKLVEPDTVRPGETLDYKLTVSNNGNKVAPELRVWDVFAKGDNLVSERYDYQPQPHEVTGDTVWWNIDSLAAFEDSVLTYSVNLLAVPEPKHGAEIVNCSGLLSPCDTLSVDCETVKVTNPPPRTSAFRLDRSVFVPEKENPLWMIVEAPIAGDISIQILDIMGYPIREYPHLPAVAGENRYSWNGMTADDREKAGSGVYLVVYRGTGADGNPIQLIRKLILVR